MAKISHKQLSKLFQRLSTSYSAGIDLVSSYEKEKRISSSSYRKNAELVHESLKNGESLAAAMKSTSDYFPPLTLAVVQAGEKSGRLEDSFDRLARHYDNLVKFRSRFLTAISWPVFELVASVFVIGLMILIMHWVMHDIGGVDPIDWFGMGSTTGNFLLYCAMVSLFFGSIFVVVWGSMKGWFGTLPMRLARRVPLVGKTIECLSLSRFSWAMSASENAGMDVLDIGELSLNATENYYYLMVVPEVLHDLRKGKSFTKTFRATEAFPEEFLTYIENGETAGKLAENMAQASTNLQEKAESNLKIISDIGFVLMMGFVGIILAATIIILFKKLYIDKINDIANGVLWMFS